VVKYDLPVELEQDAGGLHTFKVVSQTPEAHSAFVVHCTHIVEEQIGELV